MVQFAPQSDPYTVTHSFQQHWCTTLFIVDGLVIILNVSSEHGFWQWSRLPINTYIYIVHTYDLALMNKLKRYMQVTVPGCVSGATQIRESYLYIIRMARTNVDIDSKM